MTYQINDTTSMVLTNVDTDGFEPILTFSRNGESAAIVSVLPDIQDIEILEHPFIDGFTVTLVRDDGTRQDNDLIYSSLDGVATYILSLATAEAQKAPTEPSSVSPAAEPATAPEATTEAAEAAPAAQVTDDSTPAMEPTTTPAEPPIAVSRPVSVYIRELASDLAKLCEAAIKKVYNGNTAKRTGDNDKAIRYYQAASQKMNSAVEELYELVDADLIDGLKAAAESSFKNNIPAYIGYLCGEFLKIAKSYLPYPDSDAASTEPICEFDDGEDPGYQYFDYLFCHILLCGNVSLQFKSRADLLDFVRSHPGIKLTSFPAAVYRYVAHEQAGYVQNICLSIPYYGKLRPLYCLNDDHVRQTLDFMRSIGHIIRPANPGEVPPPDIPRSHDFVDVTSEFLKS